MTQHRSTLGSLVLALGLLVGACGSNEDEATGPLPPFDPSSLGVDHRLWRELDPDSPACIAGGRALEEAVRGDLNCGQCSVITCGGEVVAHICLPQCDDRGNPQQEP